MDTASNEDICAPAAAVSHQIPTQTVPSSNLGTSTSSSGGGGGTSASGRGLVSNSTLHKQISLIVGTLKRNPLDASICQRALRALLLVLREDGATCCRQYEEALVDSMVPPLIAHPEDLCLCETALTVLAILSESTTLSQSKSALGSVLIYLLELHTEHPRPMYLLLCVLNNLAIDNLVPDLCPRLTSVFTKLLNSPECAHDARLCTALLGAVCNCSQSISPAPEELVDGVVTALKAGGGDSSVLRAAAMALGNFVRQGEPTAGAVLRSCALGRLAGFLRGNCRAIASAADGGAVGAGSAALYATLAEVIGDIAAAGVYAAGDAGTGAAMEGVVAVLLDVVRTRVGGPRACAQALRALRILCAGAEENRRFALQNAGVEVVLGVAKESLGRTSLCVAAIRTLQNMVLLDDAQEAARKEGVIEFAGEALKALARFPKACYHVLGLVASVAVCEENKDAVAKTGIVESVVSALSYHRKTDSRICEQACLALSVITTNSPLNQYTAIKRGAVELLTKLLDTFCGINYRVCTMTCRALQQIVVHDAFSKILEDSGKDSHAVIQNLVVSIMETMNMNNGNPEYCLQAAKTLVNVTSKMGRSGSAADPEWASVVEFVEESFCINQDRLPASDTLSAVLLNVYIYYAHEILASQDKLALCVCHVLDVLRFYRGNKYICTKSLEFFEAMLDGSCGEGPSNEVRFLLWKEGLAKLLKSALLIHENDPSLSSGVNSVIEKIGTTVYSDWLQHIGATKGPTKKELEYADVVAMSKSKFMMSGIFSYATISDSIAAYEIWRSAGFIITKLDNPLYWERFVTRDIPAEITSFNSKKEKEKEEKEKKDNNENNDGQKTSSQDADASLRRSSIGSDSGEGITDTYTLLVESKDFFAKALNESPDAFVGRIEKASSFVSYMIANDGISAQIAEWGLSRGDVLTIAFYMLDFTSPTLEASRRFSVVLNAALMQNKTPEQLESFSRTPYASFYSALERMFAKVPPYEGKTYRVFYTESRSEFKPLAKSGVSFRWDPIMSTTANYEGARRLCLNYSYVLANISVKKSYKIEIFTPFPAIRDEDEVLILPTSRFRVSRDVYWDSENKVYSVDIEEI